MKIIAFMLLCLIPACFSVGCPAEVRQEVKVEGESPREALEDLKDAYNKQDVVVLEKRYLPERWKDRQIEIRRDFDTWRDEGTVVSIDYKDDDIKVEGDRATVPARVTIKKKDGTEDVQTRDYTLIRKSGKWVFED